MLSETLESYLHGVDAGDITEIILLALATCLVLALILARGGWAPRFTAYASTLLTSLGIFGTFVGIVVGLLDFDPNQLDQSIGKLLDGLKTAFITSLAGIGTGIIFKIASTTPWLNQKTAENESEVEPADILAALNDQTQLLQATKDAIAGDEESSLAGQMKLLRVQTEDRHRKDSEVREEFALLLLQKLDTFSEMLSRSATEQIIDALRKVIIDFNRNLTEQFGENFKALDASVHKLVEWQEHYRQQLEQLHSLYNDSVQGIVRIELAVTRIAESSSSIPETTEKLATLLETANHQLSELERHLATFKEMRDRAVEAVPEIQSHIEEMTKDISRSVDAASEHYRKLLDSSESYINAQDHKAREILETLSASVERVQRDIQSVQEQVKSSIHQMQMEMENTMKEVLAAQAQTTGKAVDGLSEQMQRAVSQTGEGVNKQLEALDQAMHQELTRVMNQMAQALGQITGKFAEDYGRLVDAMDRVVRRKGGER